MFSSQIKYILFDEADTILDSGNLELMAFFMRIAVNDSVISERGFPARAFFISATLSGSLKQFITSCFGEQARDFAYLMDSNTHLNLANIRHDFEHLPEFDKHKTLERVIGDVARALKGKPETAIVFCDSVKSAQSTEYFIKQLGHEAVSLHGDIPAKVRIQNYDRFQKGDIKFLVCTDLASRGLGTLYSHRF